MARRVRFSRHAMKKRMPQRKIAVAEVLGSIERPEYTFLGNQPGTLECYGTTNDGRAFYAVVTDDRSFVITVVDL
jgi:hypothetical protein